MKAWKLVLTAVLALLFVSPGMAQDEKRKKGGNRANPEETFKRMDENSDGKVTFEEFKKWASSNERMAKAAEKDPEFLEKSYHRIDTKKSGSFNLEEYKEYRKKQEEQRRKKDPETL
ncbi:MAG TPA: EF-hand domain-containing protein [Gemmatales bacterium]|nr:EF-hand domain-containing protein [Gemmatales bacterium]HMP15841.1 EF-hand domain-containing protein [Gemmatales bacterium]